MPEETDMGPKGNGSSAGSRQSGFAIPAIGFLMLVVLVLANMKC